MVTNRRHDERGAVIPLVAMVLTALIIFASLAIDLDYQRVVRRDMQALADVVALDLARRVDGVQTRAFYESDPAWALAIAQSRDRNLGEVTGDNITLTVQLGTTSADGTFTESAPTGVPRAVKVTAEADVDQFFRASTGHVSRFGVAMRQLSSSGTSTPDSFGNFMIGSFFLGTNPSLSVPLLNRVLARTIGRTDLGLDLLSYQGLANSSIDLGDIADVPSLGVGSPDELASTGPINAADFFLASAQVLQNQGDTAGAQVFQTMATQVDSNATVDLGNVLVEQGGSNGQLGANTAMNGLFLLNAAAFAINGNNLIDVPALNFGIPGVTNTRLQLQVIQRPQYCATPPNVRPVGCSVSTSQVRVRLENTVDLNLSALLAGARLTGNIVVDTTAANATGTLTAIRCPTSSPNPGIDVSVVSGPIQTTASQSLDLTATVTVLGISTANVKVLDVDVASTITPATGAGGSGTFDYPSEFLPHVGTGSTQRFGNPNLGISASLNATGSNSVSVGGLGVPSVGSLTNVVNVGLAPTITALNRTIVQNIAQALGLEIGGADIGAVDLRCFETTTLIGGPAVGPPQVN